MIFKLENVEKTRQIRESWRIRKPPAGRPHPLLMLNGTHSYFGEGQARYQGHEIGGNSDPLGSQ